MTAFEPEFSDTADAAPAAEPAPDGVDQADELTPPGPLNLQVQDGVAVLHAAAVPEVAGITPGSPEHLDVIGKAFLILHSRLQVAEQLLLAHHLDGEGAERVIRQ